MEKEEFELLCKSYTPIIGDLLEKNHRFYLFNETIKWCFNYNEEESIVATCDRRDKLLRINLKSVMRACFEKDLFTIEYYLLHEVRHIYQLLVIKTYSSNGETGVDKEIIEKWIYECNNYISSLDKDGNEDPNYFLQDSEMDAYAFSYAVMKYKYKNIEHLFLPSCYGTDFEGIVDEWIEYFKEENISRED